MADYIDGTTYKIALADDQLITLFEDRPESLVATLVFGDPTQLHDTDAVIAAQREVVAIADTVHGSPDRDRAIYDAMRMVAKIRGA